MFGGLVEVRHDGDAIFDVPAITVHRCAQGVCAEEEEGVIRLSQYPVKHNNTTKED